MIRIEKLTKYYAKQKQASLDNVSLSIPDGCVFGLLGPNGAGKTTLISILVGLQKQSSGEVWFNDSPLEQSLPAIRANTGFVPQDLAFYPMLTVSENLSFYAAAFGINKAQIHQHIAFSLETTRLQEHMKKKAENLSGGLKRRLNLAIGLLNRPQLLILDEPTVGIDPQSRNFILETIASLNKEHGITIIYTSHYMQEVQQLCDTIALLDRGRVTLQGPLQDLLNTLKSTRLEFRLKNKAGATLQQLLMTEHQAHSEDGYNFVINQSDIAKVMQELPALLAQQDNAVNGFRYGFHDLEALYMSQTQQLMGEPS